MLFIIVGCAENALQSHETFAVLKIGRGYFVNPPCSLEPFCFPFRHYYNATCFQV